METLECVSVIVRHNGKILTLYQREIDRQYWFLPFDMLNCGEKLVDAIPRVVSQTTRLKVVGDVRLAFVSCVENPRHKLRMVVFVFELNVRDNTLTVNDSALMKCDAAFVDFEDAIERTKSFSLAAQGNPLFSYLNGDVPPGLIWEAVIHNEPDAENVRRAA